jgi:branched-chain amino acid transport system substrate-binding protein
MKYLIACCLSAVVAALPLTGSADDAFVIPVIAPLTGPSAFLGKKEAEALGVFETTVNKNGGVRGRPIHFDIQDDQSIAQNAVQLMNGNIARKATVVIGSATVSTCGAMLPLLENGPVVYCFSPGIHPPDGSYMFSASISTADYLIATIRYLRDRGWTKVALVTSNDATGQEAEKSIDAIMASPENRGVVSIVDREHFNATDISTAAQMSHIKSSGAQAAILWTVGTPFGTILRDATQSGLTIPLITSAGNLNYAQLIGYQSIAPDNLYIMAPPWAAPDAFTRKPAFRKYLHAYLDAFKAAGIRPDQGESLAWDPAEIFTDAWRRFGFDASPATIRSYIANLQGFTGVNGAYDFKAIPQRGIGIDWLVMVRWDKTNQSLVAVSKPGGEP